MVTAKKIIKSIIPTDKTASKVVKSVTKEFDSKKNKTLLRRFSEW